MEPSGSLTYRPISAPMSRLLPAIYRAGRTAHDPERGEDDWPDDSRMTRLDWAYVDGKVTVNGELYGTLCCADRDNRDHQFDESERAFVELLSSGYGIELAGEAVETKLRELNETAQRLRRPATRRKSRLPHRECKRVLGLPMTGIWWYDDGKDALVPAD